LSEDKCLKLHTEETGCVYVSAAQQACPISLSRNWSSLLCTRKDIAQGSESWVALQ